MNADDLVFPDFSDHPPAPKLSFEQYADWVFNEIIPVLHRRGEMTKEKLLEALSASGVDVSRLGAPAALGGDAVGVADAAGEGVGVAGEVGLSDTDVELREGESLEDLRARLKPRKKSGISAEMLDTANSYDDKVTVVRMLVSQDAKRVALVLKNLITRDIR